MAAIFEQNPIFKHLSEQEKICLSLNCKRKLYYPESTICLCGDVVKYIYFILNGRVILRNYTDSGQHITYSILCGGDMIGHTSAIEGICHITNAMALDACELLVINKNTFLELLKNNESFTIAVTICICEQLRSALSVIDDICGLDMPARLAKILLTLASNGNAKDGCASLHVGRISQNVLADIIGSSRQSVNRVLRDWEGDGVVVLSRTHIIICNKDKLEALSSLSSSIPTIAIT